jgi:DNA transposition AAA+ family ATPase
VNTTTPTTAAAPSPSSVSSIETAAERRWLLDYKDRTGLSWSELAQQSGIPSGTLSQFGAATYGGNNDRVAADVARFRQKVAAQAELALEAPEIPDWFDTPTSSRISALLSWAQRGRITVLAMGPGTGKTKTAKHYRDLMANVWLTTMAPSTAGVNNMQIETLASMGERDARGTPQALSARIKARVKGTGGLLIFDEAQHLSEKSIEEIRSWHDATGIGIALLGNEEVIARLEGGSRRAAFAQLYSRVGMRHIQAVPLTDDARTLAAAWGVKDAQQLQFVETISQRPGGLRGCTMTLELASMIAAGEERPLSIAHLRDAWGQLASRRVAA